MTLTLTPLPGIPIIQPGDDLVKVIVSALHSAGITLVDGDILILAQKIVSKSEGRFRDLNQVTPSPEAIELAQTTTKDPRLVELILQESRKVIRACPGVIIVEHRLGFICASAGIDHSNVQREGSGMENPDDVVLLLPDNPDGSAKQIKDQLENLFGVRVGVAIIDSHGRAWRLGTVGITIGLAGLPGVVDCRGQPDLFDRTLRITEVGAADELAGAASLVMGQAAEGTPVVHVRGFPYALRESSLAELLRPESLDLFR